MTAAAIGILTDRRTEECIPFVFLGTCFCLYIFYCFNFLTLGRIIVYFFMAVSVGMAVIKLFKNKNAPEGRKNIFTPAVAVFLLLTFFFFIYSLNLKPAVWDELRLWSAMPKALHFSPFLQVGEGSLLYSTMQSYPPGMALFTYFLTAFQETYDELSPFFAVSVLGLALFLPAFKNINWKKWVVVLPAVTLFLLIPVLLSINGSEAGGDWAYYYLSLFIDPTLGLLLGYGVYLAVQCPFENWFTSVNFALCVFMLPALKNTGAMYGAIVVLIAIVISFLEKNKKKSGILKVIPSILAFPVSYFSWQWIIRTKGNGEFIDFNLSGITIKKISNVFSGITTWGKIPFLWIALFFLIVGLWMTFFRKDISKKKAITAGVGFLMASLLFFYGYTSHYGIMMSSIHRYTQTLTFAMFLYLLMRILAYAGEHIEVKRKSTKIFVLIAEILLCTAAIWGMTGYKTNQYPNPEYHKIKAQVDKFQRILETDKEMDHPAKCYLIIGGEIWKQSQRHETYYQNAVGTGIDIKNIWCDKLYNEADWGEVTDLDKMTDIWAENLSNQHYEYVLVADPDEEIKSAVHKISPSVSVEGNLILKVEEGTGKYPVSFQIVH